MPGHKMGLIAENVETCSPEVVEAMYAVMVGEAVAVPKNAANTSIADAQAAEAKTKAEAQAAADAKAAKKKADADAKAAAEAAAKTE